MKNCQFTESRIISILTVADAGNKVKDICRRGLTPLSRTHLKSPTMAKQGSYANRIKNSAGFKPVVVAVANLLGIRRAQISREPDVYPKTNTRGKCKPESNRAKAIFAGVLSGSMYGSPHRLSQSDQRAPCPSTLS